MRSLVTLFIILFIIWVGVLIITTPIVKTNQRDIVDQCVLDNKDQLNVKDWCIAKIRLNK